MQVSDIANQISSHLLDGETLTEEPSDYFGDRMLTVTTQAASAHAYIIDGMYALAALDGIEAWRPGDKTADTAIAAVLDYARRNGKPAPPPDPNEVFADALTYLRPLLQEGETITTDVRGGREPELRISGPAATTGIWQSGKHWCFASILDLGYTRTANTKEDKERLLLSALNEARTPTNFDAFPHGNR